MGFYYDYGLSDFDKAIADMKELLLSEEDLIADIDRKITGCGTDWKKVDFVLDKYELLLRLGRKDEAVGVLVRVVASLRAVYSHEPALLKELGATGF